MSRYFSRVLALVISKLYSKQSNVIKQHVEIFKKYFIPFVHLLSLLNKIHFIAVIFKMIEYNGILLLSRKKNIRKSIEWTVTKKIPARLSESSLRDRFFTCERRRRLQEPWGWHRRSFCLSWLSCIDHLHSRRLPSPNWHWTRWKKMFLLYQK